MTTTRKQSLRAAVRAIQTGAMQIHGGLDGLPVGGWPETQQAVRQLEESIPGPWARSYTVEQIIDAVWATDASGRFVRRGEV